MKSFQSLGVISLKSFSKLEDMLIEPYDILNTI